MESIVKNNKIDRFDVIFEVDCLFRTGPENIEFNPLTKTLLHNLFVNGLNIDINIEQTGIE